MKIALYARVSSWQQARDQTIEQQLDRLQAFCRNQTGVAPEMEIFRDEGYSGATLRRPGLDRLRDQVSMGRFDQILITAPDRLARKYVHQMLLIEEFEGHGCQVAFVERPMSQDPNDQLLLQRCSQRLSHMHLLRDSRLLHHRSSMISPSGWEQQINTVPSAGHSSGSGW